MFSCILNLLSYSSDFVKNLQSTAITWLFLWIILVPEIKPAIPLPGPEPKPKPEPGKQAYSWHVLQDPHKWHVANEKKRIILD